MNQKDVFLQKEIIVRDKSYQTVEKSKNTEKVKKYSRKIKNTNEIVHYYTTNPNTVFNEKNKSTNIEHNTVEGNIKASMSTVSLVEIQC